MQARTALCKHNGFTLLEVLIALLVLSIGLLGLAGLQTIGLRSSQMATMRTLATQRTYDLSERMRANPAGVYARNYELGVTAAVPASSVECAPAPASPTPPPCTPAQMAAFDLARWLEQIIQPTDGGLPLPGGRGRITRAATGTLVKYTITVFWDEERTGTTGSNCGDDPQVDLRCIQLTL